MRFRLLKFVTSRFFLKWCSSGVVSAVPLHKTIDFTGFSGTFQDTAVADENGNEIDPMEPSAPTILYLMMGEPELEHEGEWFAWFGTVLICVINALLILSADELFR